MTTLREQLAEAEGRAAARRTRRAAPEWCVFARGAGCCSEKYECRRDADLPGQTGVVRVVPASECNADCPRRVERPRIGAAVTPHNGGGEVRGTVGSLAASVREDGASDAGDVLMRGTRDGA